MRLRRIIYTIILGIGILWIINTRPAWMDPMRMVNAPINGPAARDFERDERSRVEEMSRRIKLTAVGFGVAVVVVESLAFVGRRFRRRPY